MTQHLRKVGNVHDAEEIREFALLNALTSPRGYAQSVAILRAMGVYALLTNRAIIDHDGRTGPLRRSLKQSRMFSEHLPNPASRAYEVWERQKQRMGVPHLWNPQTLRPPIEDSLELVGGYEILRRYHELHGDADDLAARESLPDDLLFAAAIAAPGASIDRVFWQRFSRDVYGGIVQYTQGNRFARRLITAALYPSQVSIYDGVSNPDTDAKIAETVGALRKVFGRVGPPREVNGYAVHDPFTTVDTIVYLLEVGPPSFGMLPSLVVENMRAIYPVVDRIAGELPPTSRLATADKSGPLVSILRGDANQLRALADAIEFSIREDFTPEDPPDPARVRRAFGIVALLRQQQKLQPGNHLPATAIVPAAIDPIVTERLEADGALYLMNSAHAKYGDTSEFPHDPQRIEDIWDEIKLAFDIDNGVPATQGWPHAHAQTSSLLQASVPPGQNAHALLHQATDGHKPAALTQIRTQ